MSVLERLTAPGPKRLLALDGGGIRGAITLGFLEQMERLLRVRHKREDLKLCDYFDLIGGTSTGAIIASGLAIGMTAYEIKRMYLELGGKVFSKNKWWRKLRALFDPEQLRLELHKVFGDRTLGDPSIHTGLCIIAKRADTGSTWPYSTIRQGSITPTIKISSCGGPFAPAQQPRSISSQSRLTLGVEKWARSWTVV
ncbi:MAG TPA: patatin-like phospholipase family protein [Candidatus Tectomicrobia bacterium]